MGRLLFKTADGKFHMNAHTRPVRVREIEVTKAISELLDEGMRQTVEEKMDAARTKMATVMDAVSANPMPSWDFDDPEPERKLMPGWTVGITPSSSGGEQFSQTVMQAFAQQWAERVKDLPVEHGHVAVRYDPMIRRYQVLAILHVRLPNGEVQGLNFPAEVTDEAMRSFFDPEGLGRMVVDELYKIASASIQRYFCGDEDATE